jgi:integrase
MTGLIIPIITDVPRTNNKKELNVLFAAKDIPDYSLIVTLELTGARPGELLANHWKDYDFASRSLRGLKTPGV